MKISKAHEVKVKLIQEHMIDELANCVADCQDGHPGADEEYFRTAKRAEALGTFLQGLGMVDYED